MQIIGANEFLLVFFLTQRSEAHKLNIIHENVNGRNISLKNNTRIFNTCWEAKSLLSKVNKYLLNLAESGVI